MDDDELDTSDWYYTLENSKGKVYATVCDDDIRTNLNNAIGDEYVCGAIVKIDGLKYFDRPEDGDWIYGEQLLIAHTKDEGFINVYVNPTIMYKQFNKE